METVQCWLSRSSSNGPKRARIKPLTTPTQAGKAIATHMLASPQSGWQVPTLRPSQVPSATPTRPQTAFFAFDYRFSWLLAGGFDPPALVAARSASSAHPWAGRTFCVGSESCTSQKCVPDGCSQCRCSAKLLRSSISRGVPGVYPRPGFWPDGHAIFRPLSPNVQLWQNVKNVKLWNILQDNGFADK